MRLSDLLEADVVDEGGRSLGRVHDVRLVQDGPAPAGRDPSFRVLGLLLGNASIGRRLGYHRGTQRAPWLLRTVLGRGRVEYLPWERVRRVEQGRIVAAGPAEELP